jgi:hypothetical protein
MKRTVEELIALRAKRGPDDREKLREERRRAANRAKRWKMRDGDLIKELGLTQDELRGLVVEAQDSSARKRWARLGAGLGAREEKAVLSQVPLPEAAE